MEEDLYITRRTFSHSTSSMLSQNFWRLIPSPKILSRSEHPPPINVKNVTFLCNVKNEKNGGGYVKTPEVKGIMFLQFEEVNIVKIYM